MRDLSKRLRVAARFYDNEGRPEETVMWVAADALEARDKRIAELEKELAGLQDPATVWVNILRGTIARPRALDHYEEMKSDNERLRAALAPFTHPDLRAILGGNSEGGDSVVFQRNSAFLRICDFERAAQVLEEQ